MNKKENPLEILQESKIGESSKAHVVDVNLKEAWDTESEAEIIVETLKKEGIYKKNLLYCGFDGSGEFRIDNFFAGNEKNLKEGNTSDKNYNPIEYAFRQKIPAIAIIDFNKVELEDLLSYKAVDSSAILAIIHLKR
jgi:hypothetical protein